MINIRQVDLDFIKRNYKIVRTKESRKWRYYIFVLTHNHDLDVCRNNSVNLVESVSNTTDTLKAGNFVWEEIWTRNGLSSREAAIERIVKDYIERYNFDHWMKDELLEIEDAELLSCFLKMAQ